MATEPVEGNAARILRGTIKRALEPSTWAGIGLVLGGLYLVYEGNTEAGYSQIGAGAMAIFIRERARG